jgi:hypothetical protein
MDIGAFIIIGFFVFIFILYITVFIKQLNEEWEGKLVRKQDGWDIKIASKSIHVGEGNDTYSVYRLYFEDTKGEIRFSTVSYGEFEEWEIGDSAIKRKGSLYPKRVLN